MSRPMRLRYVNQIVGVFVLIILVVVFGLILLIARSQQWFAPTYELRTVIDETILGGLRRGTEVLLLGKDVGEVKSIEYLGGRQLVVTLKIKQAFQEQIFDDSMVHLRHRLAGAGEAYLEIMRGPKSRFPLKDGHEIKLIGETEPAQELERVVGMVDDIRQSFRDVRDAMVPAFERFDELVENLETSNQQLSTVLRDLEEVSPRFSPLADQAESVLAGSQQAVADLQRFTPRLEPIAIRTEQVLAGSQAVVENLRSETDDLLGTSDRLQDGIQGANDVIDGLKRHWLLRRWVNPDGPSRLISPSNVEPGGHWP